MSVVENDYDLSKKIRIKFAGMPYWVMPRYQEHYVNHEYERFSIRLLHNLTNENTTVLDIGAHYGAYSLYSAKHRGSKVISLEPVNENYSLLELNVKENKLSKLIEIHNLAASDEDGKAEFNIPWASDSAGFYNHPLAETYKKQTVKMCKADSVVKGRKIDLIKIDTEGHEIHVLDGLKNTLKANPHAILLVEANPDCLISAGTSIEALLNKLVEDCRKEVYVVSEENFTLYRITDRLEEWVNLIGEHGYANILCLPRNKHKYGMLLSHSSGMGGAEQALLELAESQRKNNIYSHVVIPAKGYLEDKLIEKGISYSIVDFKEWYGDNHKDNNLLNIEKTLELIDLAYKTNVQFVLNNTIVCPWGAVVSREQNIPLIWYAHEFGDRDHNINFPHPIDRIRKFIVDESSVVFCCSKAVEKSINDAAPTNKTITVYNPLNIANIRQMSNESVNSVFSKKSELKIVIVGRVQETKGQHIAIQALKKLKDDGIKAELAIVGDTTMAPKYKNRLLIIAKKLGVNEWVHITGNVTNPHAITKQADIALTCAIDEAFGRNTAEAMILGVPIIATSSGGSVELVQNGKTGVLIAPEDVADLKNAIKRLYNSPEVRLKMAKEAQDKILEILDGNNTTNRISDAILSLPTSNNYYGKVLFHEYFVALKNEINQKEVLKEEELVTVQAIESRRKEIENNYIDITSSLSWRITKPLRKVNHYLRKIK